MVANFKKKGNREFFNNEFLFKVVGIIFVVIILILIFSDIKIYQKKKELAAQISDYQQQIENIKKSNQNLKNEIANSDNQDYLEKLAYEQLGQAKPGEKVYSFVISPEKPKAPRSQQNFWDIKSWFGWIPEFGNWLKSKF